MKRSKNKHGRPEDCVKELRANIKAMRSGSIRDAHIHLNPKSAPPPSPAPKTKSHKKNHVPVRKVAALAAGPIIVLGQVFLIFVLSPPSALGWFYDSTEQIFAATRFARSFLALAVDTLLILK